MDFSLEWIQAIATVVQAIFAIILVGVTVAYAISTNKMANAAVKQIEYIENENYRRVVIDILENTYWLIYLQIELCQSYLEFNCLNTSLRPITPYLKKQTRPPDEILKKYNEKILEFSESYDKLFTEGKEIASLAFKRYDLIENQFFDFCKDLIKDNDRTALNLSNNVRSFFACTFASSELDLTYIDDNQKNDVFNFFTENKDKLSEFLIEKGFSEDMEKYSRIKKELIPLIDNYLTLLNNLFEEWKNEYNIIDSEFKKPYSFPL